MSRAKIAVVTESPDDHTKTWDAVREIMEPLEEDYDVTRVSCLEWEPRNGKKPGKTEIREAAERIAPLIEKMDYVVLVGNTPLQAVTGKAGISTKRGRPFEKDKRVFLPMINPGMARHDDRLEGITEKDLDFLGEVIKFGGIPEEEELDVRIIYTRADFEEMLDDLEGTISCDIESNSLYPWQTHKIVKRKGQITLLPEAALITMLGFGTARTQWVLPVSHYQSPWSLAEVQYMLERASEKLNDCIMVFHNGKFDCLWIKVHFGVELSNDFDTMLAHFLLDENDLHGLKYLAMKYCGAPDWDIGLDDKKGQAPLKVLAKYLAHDLYYTRQLRYVFGKMLAQDHEVRAVFNKILMPCSRLFVEVEYDGVYIDTNGFDEAERVLRENYDQALEELKEWEPDYVLTAKGKRVPFNWGSTQQLARLLFGRYAQDEDEADYSLGIRPIETSDAGNNSTSESVIKRIDHPCTGALLRFREAKQQLSFFIEGWKPFLHERPDGWYLHPSFKLHGTVTGRLSCEHPNLQQVPRDPRIRSLISAPRGWTLIECDLSQIELRIAAELAGERAMLYAFATGVDVHWLTALSEIERGGGLKDIVLETAWQHVKGDGRNQAPNYSESIQILLEMGPDAAAEIDSSWKELRKKAKAINFGYLYGMWWKKFKIYARDNYGVTVNDTEAQQSRESFFDKYSDFPEWHDRQRRYARKHGYVKTLSGRKRRLPEAMNASDKMKRQAAERQAINSPVQSFANELNLMAALQLRKEFGRHIVRICGTVHDAVLFRVRNDWVERVYLRMLEIMSRPELMDEMEIDVEVPIEAEGKIGPWGKGVSLKKWKEAQ